MGLGRGLLLGARRDRKAPLGDETSSEQSGKVDYAGRTSPEQSSKGKRRRSKKPSSYARRDACLGATYPKLRRNNALSYLAFLPKASETVVAPGKSPRRREFPPPRAASPHDRDRPPARPQPARAPKPGDPAPACLLEKALWVPPTTDPFRWAPGGKPEKGKRKERRNPRWHDRPRSPHPNSA